MTEPEDRAGSRGEAGGQHTVEPAGVDAQQLARVAALRARRIGVAPGTVASTQDDTAARGARARRSNTTQAGGSGANRSAAGRHAQRRAHPAQGARIAAAGIGASGVLGLVAAFGFANPPEPATVDTIDPATGAPDVAPVVGAAAPGGANATGDAPVVMAGSGAAAVSPSPMPTPIRLTARPVVRTVIVQPPPLIAPGEPDSAPAQPASPNTVPAAPPAVSANTAPAAAPPAPPPDAPAPVAPAPAPPTTSGSG